MNVRRWAALLLLNAVFPAIMGAHLRQQSTTAKQGTLSEVRLLDLSRLPSQIVRSASPAQDGFRMVFLILSRVSGEAVFTMQELRDVTVDGRSYREVTVTALGKPIEPMTTILKTEDLARIDGSVRQLLRATTRAAAMVVDIPGATRPARGQGRVLLKVGWNDRLEEFAFQFDMSQVPSESPYSRLLASK
jgi:hypothetical protein